MKHLKIHKFPFKNVIVLAIECKMYLKNFTALVAFQNRPCAPSWRKQGWIPRRTISWWKASLPPQKESWAFFGSFSFHFLSFNGVFLTLKCRTFVLKHLHGDRAATILLKMDICHYGFQIWKREYSRALDASYTFQPLMSFWRNLIYTLENPLWAWPFFRRWHKVSTPYLRARWTFRRTRRVFIFLKIRQQNNAKYAFHYTFKNKVGA